MLFNILIIIFTLFWTNNASHEFEIYKKNYMKLYSNSSLENSRRLIFRANLQYIRRHNEKYKNKRSTYSLSVNKFTDLTHKEVIDSYTGRKKANKQNFEFLNSRRFSIKLDSNITLPKSIDWRTKGLVTMIKNQGNCGACWAFSVAGALEGQYIKKLKKKQTFSAQQLIDCNSENWGCNGGFEEYAFDYVEKNGITNEQAYPYKFRKQNCTIKEKYTVKFGKYFAVPINEYELMKAVATIGPISIAIFVNKGFEYYTKGVYSTKYCKNDYYSLNHAAVLVGYGKDNKSGLDYWLVKNSWGSDWGENGYIRMRRNYKNMCGIATNGLYAFIV